LAWPQWTGAAVIVVAGLALVECFIRFALEGEGTPAPVAPTKKLVVKGLYRYVRNPMYVAVVGLILGQALLFESTQVAWYGAAIWFFFHVFVFFFEERRLRREFGADYVLYRANVPRWIPRLTPWRPEKKVSD
jgi:protein-S-isoprenylcysteine O-methyltransferase Ste14